MSAIKFHHVFGTLLVLSGLSAFAIPERYATKAQPQVQSLFYPVARPVRGVAEWFSGRVAKPAAKDARDREALLAENDELRQELALLARTVDELRRRDAELEKLGPIRERCTTVQVVGADAGSREALLVRGSTLEGLRQNQPVLFGGGVVGTIDRPPGFGGASVRLITDPGVRVGAFFMSFPKDASGRTLQRRLDTPPVLVEGVGQGAMRCATALTMEEVEKAELRVNDMVFVEDNDWDKALQYRRLGKVVRIAPQPAAPLYADIRIEPTSNLMRLREVMVLTR